MSERLGTRFLPTSAERRSHPGLLSLSALLEVTWRQADGRRGRAFAKVTPGLAPEHLVFGREHSGRLWKQLVVSGGGEQEQSDSRWPGTLAFAVAAAATTQIARLAAGFPSEESWWLLRNASLLVVPFLAGYFARQRRLPLRRFLAGHSSYHRHERWQTPTCVCLASGPPRSSSSSHDCSPSRDRIGHMNRMETGTGPWCAAPKHEARRVSSDEHTGPLHEPVRGHHPLLGPIQRPEPAV